MDPVVHFEVPFDDKERATKFYSEVFGWQMNDMPEMKYTIARTGECDEDNMLKEKGMINGGLMERSVAENPVIVIKVASVDAVIEKIKSAGGAEVKPKVEIGGMGYYAYVKDSEGNVIGVWEDIKK